MNSFTIPASYEEEEQRRYDEEQKFKEQKAERGLDASSPPSEKKVEEKVKPKRKEIKASPKLTQMSTVKPEAVSWFWEPYVPSGKLTLLEGDPGTMKTFLALAFAAAVTRGEPIWHGETGEPGNVLYMTAEDGLGDTIRPRLDAAGADSARVYAFEGGEVFEEDGTRYETAVTLADMRLLEEAMQVVKPKLLILDPLHAYLGAKTDMHRANEVRPLLSKLGNLASRYECAVVCIRHLNKGSGGKSLYAGLGSIDFVAAARSVLQAGELEEERILAHAKSSLAPKGVSLRYDVQEGALVWLGEAADTSADDLRAAPIVGRSREEAEGALETAVSFLGKFLNEGQQPARLIEAEAKREGISARTLARAKAQLGVRSFRISKGNEGEGGWAWAL